MPEAAFLADPQSAEGSARAIDKFATNDDPNQYRHSMRSRNESLEDAKHQKNVYVENQIHLAALAVRSALPDRKAAGRYLGYALHAVQDEKHGWTSCADDSNPPESRNKCSASENDECPIGAGSHGLTIDCRPKMDTLGYFQASSDISPSEVQVEAALQRSIAVLTEFVERVK